MTALPAVKTDLFDRAVGSMVDTMASARSTSKRPLLVDHNGRPIASASYHQIERSGAKRSGSLKNWIPRRIFSDQQASMERENLVDRSIDLVNNDPHAAGGVDTFATTIIGSGLTPYPNFTADDIGFSKEKKDEVKALKASIRRIVKKWSQFADAGERMSFGGLQFLAMSNIVSFGECLFLLPMIDDPIRPYSLAMQCVNPLRLKTPSDKRNQRHIRDGVEIGKYGQPTAYWIKKGESRKGEFPDTSKYFVRIPARVGHRQNVIHIFYTNSPEQVRGVPWFAPAIKFFRDLNDYLDAELVSNVVTAAFSLFIEVEEGDPDYPSMSMADITETGYTSDGTSKETRYEELIPGTIRYGNAGEKPHTINANRPGTTFEPFIRVIEDSISSAVNIPRPVLFKQHDGMNYANYRSAMLEAWRVFVSRRSWFGGGFCTPVHRMLLEEAYLRGDLSIKNFYSKIYELSSADWIGPPKGQIEPVKEIQADEKAVALRVKTRREIALERSSDIGAVFDQLEDEEHDLKERGLLPLPGENADGSAAVDVDQGDDGEGIKKNE